MAVTITPTDVAGWRGEETPSGLAAVAFQRVCDAVGAIANRLPVDGGRYTFPDPLPADALLALLMQASRWVGRSSSPLGIAGSDDVGFLFVSRFDPDIDEALVEWTASGVA